MSLPRNCVNRPVSVLMFYTGIFLFGVISLTFLRQELFPPITYPKLSIVTQYENAAPEEIETLITKPIEEAVGSTAGLKNITSISREGLSVVIVEFGWNENMDFAALAIREKIDLIKARLPRDAQEPTVIKYNPFELPVMTLSIASDRRSPVQLKRFAERWIKDELEKINGVASVTLSGGEDEEILVEVDQGRLKASGIGVNEVSRAIAAANLSYPGGTIKESFYEYLIRTLGEFKHIAEIEKLPVKGPEEKSQSPDRGESEILEPDFVLVKDIADVYRTVQKRTSFSRFNRLENVTVSVQKQADANTIQVVNLIKKRLKALKREIPPDIHMEVVYNQERFIKEAVNGVRDAALQGGVLAFFVLLVFLQKVLTSTLVILITPITILATFTLMYFMGISLNVISLGGIALGVGMLADNAIVLIENTFRHVKENPGGNFKEHVVVASEEVIAPMFASTLTTIAVFLPMIFVTGIAGQIFKELAWVVVATQVISIVVAFTLLPVFLVKLHIQSTEAPSRSLLILPFYRILSWIGQPVAWIQKAFSVIVPAVMRRRVPYLCGIFLVFLFSIYLLTTLDRVMMPKIDQGQFMIKVDMPVGTRVEVTDQVARGVESYLSRLREVKSIASVVGSSRGTVTKEAIQQIGSHQAQIIVTLKEDRHLSTDELIQKIRTDFESPLLKKHFKGGRLSFVVYESSLSLGEGPRSPIVIDISGTEMETLKNLALKLQDEIALIPGVYDLTNSFPESAPETKINVNKDKASYYRFSVTDLATAAHISIKGIIATNLREAGKEIPIRVVLKEGDRDEISKLPFILMYSPLGVSVPLSDFVTFAIGRGPSEIKRIDQERTIQVFGKIFQRSLKDVSLDIEWVLKNFKVPDGYHVELSGQSLEMEESFASLRMALLLSILLVYMIMAAQFESYYQPFIIMFTLPLAMIGVAASLWMTSTPISVVVLLGVILLGGIVVNNGIILIDFINQMIAQGMPLADAAVRASAVRFRPILMTALTSILGLLPLALGLGEGAKLQSPMAIAVMGGIFVATFLTLVVIPALYTGSYILLHRILGKKASLQPAMGETQ